MLETFKLHLDHGKVMLKSLQEVRHYVDGDELTE